MTRAEAITRLAAKPLYARGRRKLEWELARLTTVELIIERACEQVAKALDAVELEIENV